MVVANDADNKRCLVRVRLRVRLRVRARVRVRVRVRLRVTRSWPTTPITSG